MTEKRKKRVKYTKGHTPGHAGVRYHKGYCYDKLRHVVLTASQMAEPDRETVRATIETITSGPEAMTLPNGMNGWACIQISNGYRQAVVLAYKGTEVALFYKRQLTEIEPQSESPGYHPEGVLQDPLEAWQRLDLLGPSAKKQNMVLKSLHDRLLEENRLLTSRVRTLESIEDVLDGNVAGLEKQVNTLQTRLKALTPIKPTSKAQTTARTRQNAKPVRYKSRSNTKKRGKR